jgi:poly(A) polymerase
VLIRLEAPLRQALLLVVEAAAPLPVALVGGAVRDLLLHRVHKDPWCGLPDLDLVVEQPPEASGPPAAHRIARRLAERLGSRLRRCQLHEAFGTVELEIEGVLLDLATARREWYVEPGANPTVRYGSLRDDLARRDLSINAIALLLEGRQLAEGSASDDLESPVLDPYGGQADLAARRLRFLHADSLRDDPTRIVRAARYGARLGMDLAPDALTQWHTTLNAWPWRLAAEGTPDSTTPDSTGEAGPALVVPPSLGTRLRKELDVLLGREPWQRGLELLQQWRGLELLDPALQADQGWRWRLRTSQRLLRLAELPPWPPEQWLLLALVAPLPDPLALAERLQLPHRSQVPLRGLMRLRGWLAEHPPAAQRRALTPAQLSQALERQGLTPEAVILALVSLPPEPWRRGLLRWLLRWRSLPSPTSARQLMDQGHPPGPALGERLRQLRAERLERERW